MSRTMEERTARMLRTGQGTYLVMTTDGRPPNSKSPRSVDDAPTDPPAYREAATPEEIEESQKRPDEEPQGEHP
jgi:hypothetical protein